jgi:hypothetical protein
MSGKRPIWLDVARLVERACIGSLTGIDRVELAYAEALTAVAPERTRFVMLGRGTHRLVALPHDAVLRFIEGIHGAWRNGHPLDCRRAALQVLVRAAIGPSARDVSPT